MRNEQLISDLVNMFFEAKKIVEYLPTLPGTLRKSHLQVLQMIEKLKATQEEVKVTDISKRLKISSPNITKLVNELQEMNMVTKCPSLKDKRIVQVDLTERGKETLTHYVMNYHQHLDQLIEKVGAERCQLTIETMKEISKEMKQASIKFGEE